MPFGVIAGPVGLNSSGKPVIPKRRCIRLNTRCSSLRRKAAAGEARHCARGPSGARSVRPASRDGKLFQRILPGNKRPVPAQKKASAKSLILFALATSAFEQEELKRQRLQCASVTWPQQIPLSYYAGKPCAHSAASAPGDRPQWRRPALPAAIAVSAEETCRAPFPVSQPRAQRRLALAASGVFMHLGVMNERAKLNAQRALASPCCEQAFRALAESLGKRNL